MHIQVKKDVRTFLKKLSIFVSLFIIFFHVLNIAADYYIDNHNELRYREITRNRANANAIVIGSSHGVRAINPAYLDNEDYSFYNFSFNGSNPEFYLKWYKELFRKYYPKPSLIVYEVDWFMFDKSWLWRSFNHDSEYFPLWVFFKTLLLTPDRKTTFTNRYPLIKEKDRIRKKLFGKDRESFENPLDKYYKGYIPRHQEVNLKQKIIETTNDEIQIKSFYELLDYLESEEIRVIFIQTPEYLPGRTAGNSNEFLRQVSKERNIPFLDYNEVKTTSLNYDSTCFFDWGHLNEKGSKKFSILLKDDLEEILNHQDNGRPWLAGKTQCPSDPSPAYSK